MNNGHCAEIKKFRGDGWLLGCNDDACCKVPLLTYYLQQVLSEGRRRIILAQELRITYCKQYIKPSSWGTDNKACSITL